MRDVLEELREVHKQQQATVPGHWTEQCIGRAITEMERLRAENVIMRGALDTIHIAANAARGVGQCTPTKEIDT